MNRWVLYARMTKKGKNIATGISSDGRILTMHDIANLKDAWLFIIAPQPAEGDEVLYPISENISTDTANNLDHTKEEKFNSIASFSQVTDTVAVAQNRNVDTLPSARSLEQASDLKEFVYHCFDEDGLETFHVFRRSRTNKEQYYRDSVHTRNVVKCNLDGCRENACLNFDFLNHRFHGGICCIFFHPMISRLQYFFLSWSFLRKEPTYS